MLQYAVFLLIPISLFLLQRRSNCFLDDNISKAVMLIIWGRFALASLGPSAIETKLVGFSLIALGTIALTGLGLLITPLSLYRMPRIRPFLAITALGMFSGVMNGRYVDTITYAVTWCFFLVCSLLLYRAFETHGAKKVLSCLLVVFALPLGGQILSFGLNAPKIGPDGSWSYIGVFGHEAVFSILLLCAFVLVLAYPWTKTRWAIAATCLVLFCLLVANYRTAMIAALPMFFAAVLLASGTSLRIRPRIFLVVALLAFAGSQIGPSVVSDRFNELGDLAQDDTNWMKPPERFTAHQKDALSARLYIWSSYIYGHLRSDWPQYLLGHGPEARAPGMIAHAHNEFWRVLFEFGLIGFVVWMVTLAAQIRLAFRAALSPSSVSAIAGFLSMVLAALGTAIFNRPEGMILLAVLCSTTWFVANRKQENCTSNDL